MMQSAGFNLLTATRRGVVLGSSCEESKQIQFLMFPFNTGSAEEPRWCNNNSKFYTHTRPLSRCIFNSGNDTPKSKTYSFHGQISESLHTKTETKVVTTSPWPPLINRCDGDHKRSAVTVTKASWQPGNWYSLKTNHLTMLLSHTV